MEYPNQFNKDSHSEKDDKAALAAHNSNIDPDDPRIRLERLLEKFPYKKDGPNDPRVALLIKEILFEKYKNKTEGSIDFPGFQALCAYLRVKHADNIFLRLSWKVKPARQGYLTLEEWQRGLPTLRVYSLNNLGRAFVALDKEVLRKSKLEDLYEYAFHYSTTRDKQKFIDLEHICRLLELVLGPYHHPQVDSLIRYLKVQKDYHVISLDQWRGFLQFFRTISFPDFSNHDKYEAWPVILDDYVDWMKESTMSEATRNEEIQQLSLSSV